MPFLMLTHYGSGNQYFRQNAVSIWLQTKAEDQFTSPWDGDCTSPGIMVFQEACRATWVLYWASYALGFPKWQQKMTARKLDNKK